MTNAKKVAVISGGMGGVGRATAVAFAREQYRVVMLYRNSRDDEVAEARASMPGEHIFMRCDVNDAQEVGRSMDEIISRTGRIDVAVHAAVDPIKRERILDMDESVFRSQFEAGFFGAFNFLKPIAKIMKRQRHGTLIGITSSVLGSPTTPVRMGAYTVCKIALRGFLRELHRELSSSGVRVFAVAPGLMRTRLNADLPEKFFEIVKEYQGEGGGVPMTAEAVARRIVTLCADSEIVSGVSCLVSSGEITPL